MAFLNWDYAKAVSKYGMPKAPPWPPYPNPNARPPCQMTNPAIQNDFSYYRRTISRNRINNLQVRERCWPPNPGMAWGGSVTPTVPIVPHSWMRRAR